MKIAPIFSDNLLSHYISDFRLSSVTDIRGITLLITGLVKELESGKLESLKEEEIKSRFVNTFFGDILGFNYGNSNKWQLREEKKSVTDGTKPDVALGYFFLDETKDDVRAVIEIKDATTDLDSPQKRPDKQTPIDQAFGYVSKAGGNCKWVIVSNIKEIRFYSSLDRSKFQLFLLKDLVNENKLKELLFLFHKDRFIKEDIKERSTTEKLFEQSKVILQQKDKPIHIIDKIYNSLKRFDGFGFIDPNYIATIYPFNILDEHVWHYDHQNLFTINSEIYDLLKEVNIDDYTVSFSEKLQKEISDLNITDAKYKIEWSFKYLNQCLIDEITAVKDYKKVRARNSYTIGFTHRHSFGIRDDEGIKKNIKVFKSGYCDCISCNYRSLNFEKLLCKLKMAEGNEEYNKTDYAFGNYIVSTNNFKTTYTIYKSIEKNSKGKEEKSIDYFLTKLNIKLLHNLISGYELDDKQDILDDIKSIDLDRVIYDEIEFSVDKEVKKYLIDVKEDVLIYKIQDEIEENLFKIEKLKTLYEDGGNQTSGPDLPNKLLRSYFLLYSHINKNHIIYDSFYRYKALTEKVLKGLLISYHTPNWGVKNFNEFILTEAILHISPSSFKELLKKEKDLNVEDRCIENLLGKLNNYTSSVYKIGIFNDPYENDLLSVQLTNWDFESKFTNIFSNIFTLFSRLNISKNQFANNISSLLKFLKIEKSLAWYDLKEFGKFIFEKGNLFEVEDLVSILKISIERDEYNNNKYDYLLKAVSKTISKFYPEYQFNNVKLTQMAILNCTSDDGKDNNYNKLIYLSKISDSNCKEILFSIFEKHLDESFYCNFYESLIYNSDYSIDSKNYFYLYSEKVNKTKGRGTYRYGELKKTDLIFINYILVIYNFNIDFNREELKLFTELNDFESWLLNPIEFNYKKFDGLWLTDLYNTAVLEKLAGNLNISNAIDKELKKSFNPILAEIKYKYFTT